MDIANGTEDPEEVETDNCFAFGVAKPIDEAPEESLLRQPECHGGRNADDLEEWLEDILERIGCCRREALEEGHARGRFSQNILDTGSLVLQPANTDSLVRTTKGRDDPHQENIASKAETWKYGSVSNWMYSCNPSCIHSAARHALPAPARSHRIGSAN